MFEREEIGEIKNKQGLIMLMDSNVFRRHGIIYLVWKLFVPASISPVRRFWKGSRSNTIEIL